LEYNVLRILFVVALRMLACEFLFLPHFFLVNASCFWLGLYVATIKFAENFKARMESTTPQPKSEEDKLDLTQPEKSSPPCIYKKR